MKCAVLTKLIPLTDVVDDNPLRTPSIVGFEMYPPTVGYSYRVVNDDPLDEAYDHRVVATSEVVALQEVTAERVVFQTRNSIYEVKYSEIF
jgi:hypothetical protein